METHMHSKSPDTLKDQTSPPPGAEAARRGIPDAFGWLESRFGSSGDHVWRALKSRPFVGVAGAAAVGLGLALTVGAGELAVAFAAGYAAYQVLLRHEPPSEAIEKAAKIGL
jgi:hypothetical protein